MYVYIYIYIYIYAYLKALYSYASKMLLSVSSLACAPETMVSDHFHGETIVLECLLIHLRW